MTRMNTTLAAAAVLLLLACTAPAAVSAARQKSVARTLTNNGMPRLRAQVASGRSFPEKGLVISPQGPINGTTDNTQAVCGVDTSVFSSYKNVCKMTFIAADGNTYVCSAWIIASNKLGTAGHCVVDNMGWIQAAIVKCGAAQRDVTGVITTQTYYDVVVTNQGSGVHWSDAAVLKVGKAFPTTLAYRPYQFRLLQGCATGVKKAVTVAGYPAQSGVSGCHYDGIQQWKSKGPMKCDLQDGLYPTTFDSCGGGSGSRVVDGSNYAVGIFTAAVTRVADGSCVTNLVTRILDPNGVGEGVFMQNLVDDIGP